MNVAYRTIERMRAERERRESGHAKTLLAGVFLFGLASLLAYRAFVAGEGFQYSEGTRSGVVQKVSHKGMIWKTWEGELNLGYVRGQESGIAPAVWSFSVASPEVARDLERAERAGRRVTLHYRQYLMRGMRYGSTNYDIVKVEFEEGSRGEAQ